MDKISFKNYPPLVLATIICLIIAVNTGVNSIWFELKNNKVLTVIEQAASIIFSSTTIITVLSVINRYAMWSWYLKLLGICDVRGKYIGHSISSYYDEGAGTQQHLKTYCEYEIIQNINKFRVSGKFYSDDTLTKLKSVSNSRWEEIKKMDNGDFLIRYLYYNEGHLLKKQEYPYELNNHKGVAVLTFYPQKNKIKGYYFTHERSSFGEIELTRISA